MSSNEVALVQESIGLVIENGIVPWLGNALWGVKEVSRGI
jgi:hypothetical protein